MVKQSRWGFSKHETIHIFKSCFKSSGRQAQIFTTESWGRCRCTFKALCGEGIAFPPLGFLLWGRCRGTFGVIVCDGIAPTRLEFTWWRGKAFFEYLQTLQHFLNMAAFLTPFLKAIVSIAFKNGCLCQNTFHIFTYLKKSSNFG